MELHAIHNMLAAITLLCRKKNTPAVPSDIPFPQTFGSRDYGRDQKPESTKALRSDEEYNQFLHHTAGESKGRVRKDR
jgi:hypothetical protein